MSLDIVYANGVKEKPTQPSTATYCTLSLYRAMAALSLMILPHCSWAIHYIFPYRLILFFEDLRVVNP